LKPHARWLGLLVLGLGIVPPTPTRGHDIPNARVDRAIQVDLRPGRLTIAYEVSLSELTLAQDLRQLVGPIDATEPKALFDRYGHETGPLNARGLLVTIDGRDCTLADRGFDLAIEEHPRFTFRFEAPLPPRGRLAIRDTNYVASEGTSRLALRAPGLAVRGFDGPSDVQTIPIRPTWQLTDQEEQRGRQHTIDFGPELTPQVAKGP
jgi:nickel/cobalt exporter